MYIIHSYPLSHKHEQLCLKHIFKIHNFQGQKNFLCASLVIFQTYKNVILKSVHSLE